MLKKIKKFLIFLVIPLAISLLSSCSFFNTVDEGYLIKSIETFECEDGSTKVTITYDDEDQEPIVFYIPKGVKGEDGVEGNGIASIENKGIDSTGSYTIMEITYTDTSMESTEFKIPNGVSIRTIESDYNEKTGLVSIVVFLSNGEYMQFEVPRGKDGEEGNGINGYTIITNEDKSVEITFSFTKSDPFVITIPAPQKGEEGRGISFIASSETSDQYIITINYTDGTSETLNFNRPADPNTWYTGQGVPDSSYGKNGDYWFDTNGKNIYGKSGGKWVLIHSFSDSGDSYDIEFKLNDSKAYPASMYGETIYTVDRGSYFAASGYSIPIPTRAGFDFVGWYTTANPGPTNGAFTDLTPVFSDLTLYAKWVEC